MFDELEQLLRRIGSRLPDADADTVEQARAKVVEAFAVGQRPAGVQGLTGGTRFLRRRTALLIGAALLLGGGTGFGVGRSLAASPDKGARVGVTPSFGVGFLPAKGWNVIQNGLAASGGATATAANVPLRPDDLAVSGFPSQTVGHLRASGIVIAATAYRAGSSMAGLNFPVRDLPLRLTESEIVSWTDGGHRRSAYRFLANVRGQNLDVRVFFGSSKPGPAAFAEAQAELNKLIVAAAPPVTIAARPTLVTAYDPVTVFGRTADGKSGSEVRIEEKECGFTFFHAVGISTTAEGGNWTATVSGETTTTFRARWKNGTSDEVRVVVRPRLRLERNAAGRFTLVVQAMNRFIGKTVQIQRFGEASGRWRTVKRVALQRFDTQYGHGWSIATFRLPARAGLVRAVLPKSQVGACYAAGISPSVRT